jgi:biotin carboxyl carrier protein
MKPVVAFANGTLWVHMDGETFTFESPKRQARGKAAAAANKGEITAPMPGKIIKIMVKKDETIAAQQVLIVMEAMKMEYTLKAQLAGRVAEILCEAGQQVTLGQRLARLEET